MREREVEETKGEENGVRNGYMDAVWKGGKEGGNGK